METLIAIAIGVLVATGVFLILRSRTFSVILGIMLLSYAVNLFLLAMGRVNGARPPIEVDGAGGYADPLPQALILTAIVIGFGMAAFAVVLALRTAVSTSSDHVDGEEKA